jgi:diguanylate cyclase (GGDEF)-like protein
MEADQRGLPAGLTLDVDVDGEAQRGFWLTHMRIGFGVFLAETLVVLAYLALTPHRPHRAVLLAIVLSWLIVALLGLGVAPFVAAKSWRATYSVIWTVLSASAVGVVALLDRGTESPMLVLLFLPLIYAALMFTPRAAGFCGLSALVVAAVVAVAGRSDSFPFAYGLVLFAVLGGASVLSVTASMNRTRIEQHERTLLATVAEIAATDELTGCATRRIFRQRVEEEIARANRHLVPLSLMMIDVDRFKTTNDTYGHLVGDRVLASLGLVLRRTVRSFDVVGRLGGDEFGVLLPDIEAPAVVDVANRIRRELSSATDVPVTLSIGVSSLDRGAAITSEQLFDDADFALYQVKRGGRDSVAVRSRSATH